MSLADQVLDRAAELRQRGETFVVATVVRVEPPTSARAGDKALVTADGKLWGWVGGSCSEALVRREALLALDDGQPRLVQIAPEDVPEHLPGVVSHLSTCPSAGSLDVFIDPQLPRPRLLVVGATPAAHALVRLGGTVGFTTVAVHPGATAADVPEADLVVGSLELASARPDPNTWAVVATMGHYDEDALAALLPFELAYIGLVASRRRFATVLDVLAGREITGRERIRRAADNAVGSSQEEIALATLAEIVGERHARRQPPLVAHPRTAIDPVCGMSVEIEGAMHTLRLGEATYYFCGARCLDAFKGQEVDTPSPETPQTLTSHVPRGVAWAGGPARKGEGVRGVRI